MTIGGEFANNPTGAWFGINRAVAHEGVLCIHRREMNRRLAFSILQDHLVPPLCRRLTRLLSSAGLNKDHRGRQPASVAVGLWTIVSTGKRRRIAGNDILELYREWKVSSKSLSLTVGSQSNNEPDDIPHRLGLGTLMGLSSRSFSKAAIAMATVGKATIEIFCIVVCTYLVLRPQFMSCDTETHPLLVPFQVLT